MGHAGVGSFGKLDFYGSEFERHGFGDQVHLDTHVGAITKKRRRAAGIGVGFQGLLNDEVFEALSTWSRDRIDSPAEALFTTSRGEPKRITYRGIDKLLHKYGLEAGIQKNIKAQILRNTFGVRLFARETIFESRTPSAGFTA